MCCAYNQETSELCNTSVDDTQKTDDSLDYVEFANERDEDVDNHLASQGLI